MRHHSAASQSCGRYWFLVLILLLPAASRGDSIVTQVTCSASRQATVVAAATCSQQISNQSIANESITASAGYSSSSPGYYTVQLNNTGTAGGNIGSDAQTSSSANVSLSLQTAGPVRPGFIEIVPLYGADAEYASLSSLSFSIGYLEGSCSAPSGSCSLNNPGVNYPNFPRIYNFNLGDPFSVDVNYASALGAASEDYDAHTSVQFSLQFLFFEADGVTPVDISPEPATWTLALIGLAAVGIWGRRRFTSRNPAKQ
jgi:hypothetical protein